MGCTRMGHARACVHVFIWTARTSSWVEKSKLPVQSSARMHLCVHAVHVQG